MEVYKINQISLNQTGTQFCLSYNKGFKIYRTSDYQPISSSNTTDLVIGEITCAALLYELNIVVFTGNRHNDYYHNKKLVVFDNNNHIELYSTLFKEPITAIEAFNKYIFVCSDKEINVFNFNNITKIQFVTTIELKSPLSPSSSQFHSKIWTKAKNSISSYHIAFAAQTKGKLAIHSYFDTNFSFDQVSTLTLAYASLQNMFYVTHSDLLFLVDPSGISITSYSIEGNTYQKEQEFYRGSSKGVITSIIGLSNSLIAMANLDKTIHIFQIGAKVKQNLTTFFLYNIISTNVISSTLKIRLNEITKEDKNDFYNSFFKQRGAVLFYSPEQSELNCICYNGFSYIIKLNANRMTYEIMKKIKWCQDTDMANEVAIDNTSLTLEGEKKPTENWKII